MEGPRKCCSSTMCPPVPANLNGKLSHYARAWSQPLWKIDLICRQEAATLSSAGPWDVPSSRTCHGLVVSHSFASLWAMSLIC